MAECYVNVLWETYPGFGNIEICLFNMSGIALSNFRQGNLGHSQSMHASDPCKAEIQNHPKKINYHHNVTPGMIDFLFRHKGSVSRQSRPILSRIALRHPTLKEKTLPVSFTSPAV